MRAALSILILFLLLACTPAKAPDPLDTRDPAALFAFSLRHEAADALDPKGYLAVVEHALLRADDPYALAALAAALLLAYTIVTVKDLARDHSTLSLVLWMNAATTVIGFPLALLGWRTPDLPDAVIFGVLAVSGVLSQTFFTRGLAAGEASLMASMDYLRLPFAALAGLLMFGEVLDGWTLLGAAIVIGSTVAITLRENYLARRRAPPPPQ